MRKLLILMSCLALALGSFALAGCGDDEENTADETAPTTQPQDEAGGDAAKDEASADGTTVSVIDNDYDPKEVTVKVGETVKFTWDGQVPHTVTARDKSFDSGVLEAGADFEQKFEKAGKFAYYCTLHPGQEGTVTVE